MVSALDIREWARANSVRPHDVRVWARQQEFDVGVRGPLAPVIWEAFAQSRGSTIDVVPNDKVKNLATGKCKCGRQWSGLAECHCTVCHCHFSRISAFDMHRDVNGVCVDPLTITDKYGEQKIKVRDSMWGVLYARAGESHFATETGEGLYDSLS